jgi:uncharacterized caspase-like protein
MILLPVMLIGGSPLASPQQPAATRFAALVIGNANYASVGKLTTPGKDATQMCEALRSMAFSVRCLTDVHTRAKMQAAIEDYVDSLPDDAVSVIYYAGHGLQIDRENYLVPIDAQITDTASALEKSVSLSFLMRLLKRKPEYLTIIILDACRNNPLATPGQRLAPGLATITDIPPSTELLYATADDGVAIDDLGNNGTLTSNLLKHLRDDGTVDDIIKAAMRGVQGDTANFRHPQRPMHSSTFGDQYCFVNKSCNDPDAMKKLGQEKARQQQQEETARKHKRFVIPAG